MEHTFCAWVVVTAAALGGGAPGWLGQDVPVELAEQTIPGDPVAHAVALLQGHEAPALTSAVPVPPMNVNVRSPGDTVAAHAAGGCGVGVGVGVGDGDGDGGAGGAGGAGGVGGGFGPGGSVTAP